MKSENIKPQLSLFNNENCTQCNAPIQPGFVYCNKCAKTWIEKYLEKLPEK